MLTLARVACDPINTSESPPIDAHRRRKVEVIANGNVVKDDDVISFLTTAHGTQVGSRVYFYQQ